MMRYHTRPAYLADVSHTVSLFEFHTGFFVDSIFPFFCLSFLLRDLQKRAFLVSHPHCIVAFSSQCLPLFMTVATEAVSSDMRLRCLHGATARVEMQAMQFYDDVVLMLLSTGVFIFVTCAGYVVAGSGIMQLLDLRPAASAGADGADGTDAPAAAVAAGARGSSDALDDVFRDRYTSGAVCACVMKLLEDHSDLAVTWATLRLADELMQRLAQVYRELFARQGM